MEEEEEEKRGDTLHRMRQPPFVPLFFPFLPLTSTLVALITHQLAAVAVLRPVTVQTVCSLICI